MLILCEESTGKYGISLKFLREPFYIATVAILSISGQNFSSLRKCKFVRFDIRCA